MRIEVFNQTDGLSGCEEVWIKVLSNEVVDWPTIKNNLSADQAELMEFADAKPSQYYPHLVTEAERAEHCMAFEDWFVFKIRRTA